MTTTTFDRPAPVSPWSGAQQSLALAQRALLRTVKAPEQLLDVIVQPVLMLVVMAYLFGGAVAGSVADYLQFLVPGILGMSILTAAIPIGVSLNTDMEKGIFDRFRSLPIARSAPLVGAVLGDVVRYVIVTVVTLLTGLAMGFRIGTDWPSALLACALAVVFAMSLSWVSVLAGMLARSPGAVQGILFPALIPLMYASNVFVPTETLPGWLQSVVGVNPLTHLVEAMRALLVGGDAGSSVWWLLVWCVGLVAVFGSLASWAYRRKV